MQHRFDEGVLTWRQFKRDHQNGHGQTTYQKELQSSLRSAFPCSTIKITRLDVHNTKAIPQERRHLDPIRQYLLDSLSAPLALVWLCDEHDGRGRVKERIDPGDLVGIGGDDGESEF